MIILLSPEQPVTDESAIVNTLLERGLSLFHIRKYQLTDTEMVAYVNDINRDYRKQLVLHSHFHLANELGIERLHVREEDRKQHKQRAFTTGFTLSTSVHAITTFNTLDTIWDYAFLSPVFPSISKKGYGITHTVLDDLRLHCNPHVRLVGLGGIDEQNYRQVFTAGADAIALLGAIWNSPQPIQIFDTIHKDIQKELHHDAK
ncbi:thiamine phosphate synthase [Sphingobacterium corticibacterium]|uniref:Thiamine phosphate synthase n=1 Tax=Sphingobacterium corticibacterium TaxID=2484746 RepID=A0A4Q6XWH0_9SPHI|nr:thiamine phosphate synthase [Sphingobacterium corticibacterium]RZF62092.1 thiamine phosphate synthase [Sphingobacterium corticibacterium]